MSTASTIPAINGTVTVAAPIEKAFRIFTESIATWWPPAYHIGEAEMAEAVMEPRVGGRWYERGVDGSECDWGQVLVWEPPHRLVVTWQITGEWRYDPDPERASEVEVRFTADGPEQTTVELQHRLLERLTGGQAMHDAISGAGGWAGVLAGYVAAVPSES